MHRTGVLGLGLILGVVGSLFLIVGYQNSDAFVCTNVGVPNCFASGNNTTVAYALEVIGMPMTGIGILLIALVVLDNVQNRKTHVAIERGTQATAVTAQAKD